MIRLIFFFFLSTPHFLSAQSNEEFDPAILSLTQYQFDSKQCCWRQLSQKKQFAKAAALITYYTKHSRNAERKMPLRFHTGQMYALDGNNDMAVRFIRKTYTPFHPLLGDEDGRMWYYYARGLVAFLKNDKSTLSRIVAQWPQKFPQEENYQQLKALNDAAEGQSYFEVMRDYVRD